MTAGLAVGVVLLLAGCSSGMASPASTGGTAAQGTQKAEIAISNFMFIPAKLTVSPGATVTVVNRDNVDHTVTGSSGGFDTMHIPANGSATFTAPMRAGSYPYICSIHQYMSGTLVVT